MTGIQQIADVEDRGLHGVAEKKPAKVKIVEGSLNGIKYKGPRVDLKEGDNIDQIFRLHNKMHVSILDLADPEQLEKYESICQSIAQGEASLSKEELRYNKQPQSWTVFIRYMEEWYSLREK
jgi:hypothetical protein